jgi:hypothetical protein
MVGNSRTREPKNSEWNGKTALAVVIRIQSLSLRLRVSALKLFILVSEIIFERIVGAAESQILPWDLFFAEITNIQTFIGRFELAAYQNCGEDDDYNGYPGVRVDSNQLAKLDVGVDLFPGLADGCLLDGFTTVDESSREDPLSVTRIDGATRQNDFAFELEDRASCDFRIEKEDEPTIFTYESFGFIELDLLENEAAPAFGTKLILQVG